MHIVELH